MMIRDSVHIKNTREMPIGISIRPREEIEKYDWSLNETDESGFFGLVVPAVDLHQAKGDTEIVAVCLDTHEPVFYLMGSDFGLYYCHWSDEIVEQFFPMQDYRRWKNSWKWGFDFLAEEPFPVGWRYFQGVFSDIHFIISESLCEEFERVKEGKGPWDVYRDFPRLIEHALLLK